MCTVNIAIDLCEILLSVGPFALYSIWRGFSPVNRYIEKVFIRHYFNSIRQSWVEDFVEHKFNKIFAKTNKISISRAIINGILEALEAFCILSILLFFVFARLITYIQKCGWICGFYLMCTAHQIFAYTQTKSSTLIPHFRLLLYALFAERISVGGSFVLYTFFLLNVSCVCQHSTYPDFTEKAELTFEYKWICVLIDCGDSWRRCRYRWAVAMDRWHFEGIRIVYKLFFIVMNIIFGEQWSVLS